MNYKIFTDSSSGLPKELIEKYSVGIVNLSYLIDGKAIKGDNAGSEEYYKEFYALLRSKENLSTSCANVNDFMRAFTPVLNNGEDILYIGFSSGLSATYSCAELAVEQLKNDFPDRRILCVDSLLASLGEGLLVYNACLLKEQNKTIDEVYKEILSSKNNINSLFTVKTLSYLARGGRISKISCAVGTVVDVKPTMYVNDGGKLVAYGKVIGRKRSIFALADKVCKTIVNPKEQTIFISHGDCIDDAKLLQKLIENKILVKGFCFNYVDPVIAIHSGPDTLAVFYSGLLREESVSSKIVAGSLLENNY